MCCLPEVNNFTSDEVAADEKEDEDEEIATPAAKRSAHGKKNATAAPKTAKAKPVAKKDQKSKVDTVARKEATFADVDFALWAPEPATLPNPMPKVSCRRRIAHSFHGYSPLKLQANGLPLGLPWLSHSWNCPGTARLSGR